MRVYNKFVAVLFLFLLSLTASAQSEGGLLLGAEANKKLSKELSISLEIGRASCRERV